MQIISPKPVTPWLMLISRSLLFRLFQGLLAMIFLLAGILFTGWNLKHSISAYLQRAIKKFIHTRLSGDIFDQLFSVRINKRHCDPICDRNK